MAEATISLWGGKRSVIRGGMRWLPVRAVLPDRYRRGPGRTGPLTGDRPRTASPAAIDRVLRDEFGLALAPEQAYFRERLDAARALKSEGARFRQDDRGQLLCEVGGICVHVRDGEELEILREIYVDRVYDLAVPGPALVWDIGMNVGLASLYFAARGNTQVIGYEPIASTYRLALDNLDLNPALRHAITPVNSGIGGRARTEEVAYCPDRKGSVGLRGAAADPLLRRLVFHLPLETPIWTEPLPMEDAVSVLCSIRAGCGNVPVIAKIDCEGAEYEIVQALHDSGDLASLHALIIEWHADGPDRLRAPLVDAGFTVIAPGPAKGLWGKIYAVRG